MPKTAANRNVFDWDRYGAYALALLESTPLYRALLASSAVYRLRDVSFLGALTLFSDRRQESDSRFDHTVGVAYLMLRAARGLGLSAADEKLLVAAAILHDVGHGALSHSTETYYRRRFSVDHKTFTKRIILGDLFIGREISDLLRSHGVEPEFVAGFVNRLTGSPFEYLLHGPINVDTIDGITRASRFFGATRSFTRPDEILSVLVDPSPQTQAPGDHFWHLKDSIYNSYIYRLEWAIYDSMITRALTVAHKKIVPDDFLLSDTDFRRKFQNELHDVSGRYETRHAELVFEMRTQRELPKQAKRRQFKIDENCRLASSNDIAKRYIEVKSTDVSRA